MMERLQENRWIYILISVLLATMFWLYVRAEVDPSQSTTFKDIPVVQSGSSVLTRQGLTVSSMSQTTVDLRVEAPTSVLDDLRRNFRDISVTVDVSRCEEGENRLRFTPNWPVNVNTENVRRLEQHPDMITVTVDKLYTKSFSIGFQLRGAVASGYQAGTAAINPESVIVSGSVEQVSQISRIVAILENENLNERFAGDLPLTLLDANGEPLTDLDVTLDTETAYVVLPVVVVREIPLTVSVVEGGGASERDAKIEISPRTIMVSGAEEDMREMTEISLGSVELAKIIDSTAITRTIGLDPSLENLSGISSATIQISINGLSTRSLEVSNINLSSSVPEGYQVSLTTQAMTVTLRGSGESLEEIDPSQVRIVADVSDITSVGTYPVPARVYLDAGEDVGIVGEYNVIVNVSR